MKNNIIAFEGIDGSGKTTITNMVKKQLEKKGHKVELISELGDHSTVFLGRKAIKYRNKFKELIGTRGSGWNWILRFDKHQSLKELKVIIKLRKEIYKNVTKPLLKKGVIVIYDRFSWSTLAYQHSKVIHNRKYTEKVIINKTVKPAINFFVKCNEYTLLKRAEDRYESGKLGCADPTVLLEITTLIKNFKKYQHLIKPIIIINDEKKDLNKNVRTVVKEIKSVL